MPDNIDAANIHDPFWSVVRRRHPDLDIVVLPPEPPKPVESGQPHRAPAPFARMQLEDMEALWANLVGHGMPRHDERWIPGPTRDSVRHTATFTLDGISSTAGIGHVREAGALLTVDGWNVFTPPTGMPRINATRPGELGEEGLLFGFALETGRLFARLTSTGLPVGSRDAFEMIGATA